MAIFKVTLGIVFLTFGCSIYLLFRSKTLNIYRWCSVLGMSNTIDSLRNKVNDWNIPEFVRYSLPDGLYCAAYILIVEAIWHNEKGINKNIIIAFVPIVTICSEVLQYFGLVKGTFVIYDLICYTSPPLLYVAIELKDNFMSDIFHLCLTK